MITKRETRLKLIKAFKYAVFPLYITVYLILLLVFWLAGELDGWLLIGAGVSVIQTAPFFVGLFGAFLWSQYILEGYVQGTAKKIRCVISFSLSAIGILYSIGWLLVSFRIWNLFADPNNPFFWLFIKGGVFFVDALVVLLYPILMIVEARFKKESQACDQSADF